MPSISAATLDAWHRRVQWSTLFDPKPVRTSFWKRYASSLVPFAEPKPASARLPCVSRVAISPVAATSSASSHVASRNTSDHFSGSTTKSLCFGTPGLRMSGLVKPMAMLHVVEAVAALHAQPAGVRRAVLALHA